ncbi:hypothetical protein Tco_1081371 [Tanacetum coccineum]|uniref:Uncharacterized protein n=1 Tax=Tanacetum coccineum TaxID=301880 RepID=A0ABQ5HXH0_9ASTR
MYWLTSTPMEPNKALVKDEEAEDVDVHLYRSMIGSLMYLTASRPNIMFVVCSCARFQDSPFDLEAISNSDYAGASLDMKSTTREYVAAANCCGHVLWIQNQMLDYGFNFMNTKIYIDNESTICIVKNPVFHSKTKHIEIRHHFIRDSHEKKLIQVFLGDTHTLFSKMAALQAVEDEDEAVHQERGDSVERAATTATSLEAVQDSRGNIPRSDEDSMTLQELIALCTNRVLALETDLKQTNKVYGTAYTKLIMKVKKLEKTIKTSQARRRAKIVVSDDDMDSKDSSKQGRMTEEIDQDAGVTLVTPTKVSSQEYQPEDQ